MASVPGNPEQIGHEPWYIYKAQREARKSLKSVQLKCSALEDTATIAWPCDADSSWRKSDCTDRSPWLSARRMKWSVCVKCVCCMWTFGPETIADILQAFFSHDVTAMSRASWVFQWEMPAVQAALARRGGGGDSLASAVIGPTHNTPSASNQMGRVHLCVTLCALVSLNVWEGGVAEAERGYLGSRGMPAWNNRGHCLKRQHLHDPLVACVATETERPAARYEPTDVFLCSHLTFLCLLKMFYTNIWR